MKDQIGYGRKEEDRHRGVASPRFAQFPFFSLISRPAKQQGLETSFKVYNSLFRSRTGAKLQLSAPTRGSRRDGLGQMSALVREAWEELYMRT